MADKSSTYQPGDPDYEGQYKEDSPLMIPERQIIIGICAMAKKTKSKPMREILGRLELFEYITTTIFPEDTILNKPITEWPECDCLISFSSTGFPLQKAVEYAELYRPILINDLQIQFDIQDRRLVYKILSDNGIEVPRYAVCDREKDYHFEEYEDHIVVGSQVFHKPFVEKPVDAEDHNVIIYFPSSAGGGCQKLFRKVGNRSSKYFAESKVRREGSYMYEDFMPTDGTDVKVYTVGSDYAHAEARKAPALDGKVERDREGKEIRFPVILSATEKLIARQVTLAFKQTVCGFDFLRANGRSYVCDVNGFSFVKNSRKYYDDCAKVLGNLIMRELAPQYDIPWSIPGDAEYIPIVPTTSGYMMELRTVVAVIRHGDRTPKQKMKMEVRHPKFFELFEKYGGLKTGRLKLKRPKQLQEVLDVARFLLSDPEHQMDEKQHKVEQLKMVLEMYGHFSGINRKVQFKYVGSKKKKKNGSKTKLNEEQGDEPEDEPSLLLILKWGGELTPAGRIQAEELGRDFRCMYPGGHGDYAGYPGCGLLRLHSTYRHDLKIYASDEGRVQMTAAAFAKGLLALEGELTPILVQMVKSANMNGLLDNESDNLSECQQKVKKRLQNILNRQEKISESRFKEFTPLRKKSIINALRFLESPRESCANVHSLMTQLIDYMRIQQNIPENKDMELYHGETLEIMIKRWSKLEKDFQMKNDEFDISKIPDIYDCIKYDLQHNYSMVKNYTAIYTVSKALADVVVPQEYGFYKKEKLEIAVGFCHPLLKKIQTDLQRNVNEEDTYRLNPRYSHGVLSPGRHVRTRLYFTSESHIHSLLCVLQHGGLINKKNDTQWARANEYLDAVSELNYMSQIVIMLYEDPTKDPHSEDRFHIELHFSPGAKGVQAEESFPQGSGYRPSSQPPSRATNLAPTDLAQPVSRKNERVTFKEDPVNDPASLSNDEDDFYKYSDAVRKFLDTSKPHWSAPPQTLWTSRRNTKRNVSTPTGHRYILRKSRPQDVVFEKLSYNSSYEKGGLGSHSSLFSNRVLAGASYSVPNLLNVDAKKNPTEAAVDEEGDETSARSIRPLETLHNSLSLKQMNAFFDKVFTKPPVTKKSAESTPTTSDVRTCPSMNTFLPLKVRPNIYPSISGLDHPTTSDCDPK